MSRQWQQNFKHRTLLSQGTCTTLWAFLAGTPEPASNQPPGSASSLPEVQGPDSLAWHRGPFPPPWLHALAFYTPDTPRNFHFLIHQTCSCRFSQTLVSFWTFFSLSEYFANSCSSCKTKGMPSSVRIPLITPPWLDLITALVPNLIYTCSFPAPGKDICYMCLPSIPFFLAVVVSTSLFHRVLPSWRRDC